MLLEVDAVAFVREADAFGRTVPVVALLEVDATETSVPDAAELEGSARVVDPAEDDILAVDGEVPEGATLLLTS
jgi:hypothetical protein